MDTEGGSSVTVVGTLFPVSEGEEIKVFGFWKSHPRYGLQLQIDHWEKLDPATVEGIERYLGSGLIKGVGPTYAKRLVSAFGLETLRVLSVEPLRILDVDGIGEVRARRIMQAWQQQRGMQDVMVFLQGHGIGASMALRIYRAFGSETISRVRENPYRLAREVHGIGFLLADRIASRLGIRGDFPLRVQAGVCHVLGESAERGHCFVPLSALAKRVSLMLEVDEEKVEIAIEKLAAQSDLVLQEAPREAGKRVYLAELHRAEKRVAAAIHRLLSTSSFLQGEGIANRKDKQQPRGALDLRGADLFAALPIRLDKEQIEAARQALE